MPGEFSENNILYQIKELNKRFERVETHLDEVRLAIIQMARTEERVSVVLEQNTELFRKLNGLQKQVTDLEKENATQSQSLGVFERVAWLLAAGLLSSVTWVLKK